MLKKHSLKISKHFSYTENIDLKWLKYVLIMMVVIWATVIFINILSNYNKFIDYRLGDNIIQLVVTMVVFLLGYFGIKQQIIYSAPTPNSASAVPEKAKETSANQYQKSGLKKEESENYLQKLLQYMDEETPYLDGKLSLAQVAEGIGISKNHLSQVINANLNKNFFDFVNAYRVELIKKKMNNSSNNNITLLGLAYDCGFNSKSSFNSIFKKMTDLTPSEYHKSIK